MKKILIIFLLLFTNLNAANFKLEKILSICFLDKSDLNCLNKIVPKRIEIVLTSVALIITNLAKKN